MSFFNSFTRSAYLNVFNVCSQQPKAGEIFAIIVVFEFPTNESFKTCVNLLPLNGVCVLFWSKALIHSLRARRDLLISAPSIFVYLSVLIVSAPLSLPAKSINDILLKTLAPLWTKLIVRMAWEREDSAFAPVVPYARSCIPFDKVCIISSTVVTFISVKLTMLTCYLWSSLQ